MSTPGKPIRVKVAGASETVCRVLAAWLSEAAGQNLTLSAAAVADGDALLKDTDVVLVAAETDADVTLLARLSRGRAQGRPSLFCLLTSSSALPLERLEVLDVEGLAALPLPSHFLLALLAVLPDAPQAGCRLTALPPPGAQQVPTPALPPHHRAAGSLVAIATTRLTRREAEVLALLDQDESTEDIASALVISPYTVKRHLENIFRKLGVNSRYELIRTAHRDGLLKTRRTDGPQLASHDADPRRLHRVPR